MLFSASYVYELLKFQQHVGVISWDEMGNSWCQKLHNIFRSPFLEPTAAFYCFKTLSSIRMHSAIQQEIGMLYHRGAHNQKV